MARFATANGLRFAYRQTGPSDGPLALLLSHAPVLPTQQVPLEDALGRVLLQRRPGRGVWASLWSLPQADDRAQARAWLEATEGGRIAFDAAEPVAPVAHGFSHYRLQLQPLRWRALAPRDRVGDNDDDLRWVARDALQALGIPAPIRRLIEEE